MLQGLPRLSTLNWFLMMEEVLVSALLMVMLLIYQTVFRRDCCSYQIACFACKRLCANGEFTGCGFMHANKGNQVCISVRLVALSDERQGYAIYYVRKNSKIFIEHS